MKVEQSQYKRISMGIVAENKALNSPLIDVIPIEQFNLMDGELNGASQDGKFNGLNEDGTMYKATLKVGNTIKAEWEGETNRLTPPDVRRGEQVWLFRSGKADKYYWRSTGRDDDLRRLETVVYRFSAFTENEDEEITGDNSYYLEVSSHKKHITLKTSDRNGEYTRYTLQVNAGDGQVTIKDELGNIIQLDSANTNILIKNADDSIVELNKKKIHIVSEDLVDVQSKDVSIKCKTFTLEASGDAQMQLSGDCTVKSTGSMLVKSSKSLVLIGPHNTINL